MAPRVQFDQREGRAAFGRDARGYALARPPYPDEVYERIAALCFASGSRKTLEIGPASGLATGRLYALGACPLHLVEPDERFRQQLDEIALRT